MLHWLFDSSGFMPRHQCGAWTPPLALAYQGSQLVIALCYFAIPCCLLWLYRARRRLLPSASILVWFAAVFTLCGLGHLLDWAAFFWPAYRLHALFFSLTALVSAYAAALLPAAVAHFMSLPTPEEHAAARARARALAGEADGRLAAEASRRMAVEARLVEAESALEHLRWGRDVKAQADLLAAELAAIRKEG